MLGSTLASSRMPNHYMVWGLDIKKSGATFKPMKHPKNKNLTVDALGAMVQRGFTDMTSRFDHLEHRLDRFEKVILADYGRRLKRLEADVDYLKDALAIR